MSNKKKEIELQVHPLVAKCPTVQIKRSQINFAVYNPRKISKDNSDNLGESLDEFGLANNPTWNKRSGNLVGGHQRVARLDKGAKGKDYLLNVVQVDLDDKQEIKLNVLLNNPNLAGEFEFEKLADLKTLCADFDFEKDFKFDFAELELMAGGDNELEKLLGCEQVEKSKENLAAITEMKACREKYKKSNYTGAVDESNWDNMLTVVFNSPQEKEAFRALMGIKKGEKFLPSRLLKKLKPDLILTAADNPPTAENPTN